MNSFFLDGENFEWLCQFSCRNLGAHVRENFKLPQCCLKWNSPNAQGLCNILNAGFLGLVKAKNHIFARVEFRS